MSNKCGIYNILNVSSWLLFETFQTCLLTGGPGDKCFKNQAIQKPNHKSRNERRRKKL